VLSAPENGRPFYKKTSKPITARIADLSADCPPRTFKDLIGPIMVMLDEMRVGTD
jgi:hypothetical protein